jgi:hypothetical protein
MNSQVNGLHKPFISGSDASHADSGREVGADLGSRVWPFGVTVPAASSREPVPDWLAARLVHTVGMAPPEVAALSLAEAVDRWSEYMSKPK